ETALFIPTSNPDTEEQLSGLNLYNPVFIVSEANLFIRLLEEEKNLFSDYTNLPSSVISILQSRIINYQVAIHLVINLANPVGVYNC
ncbi:MAG: hypothetical protein RLP02_29320, partial [Coleofasciculus sp. C2-GNP5-27]